MGTNNLFSSILLLIYSPDAFESLSEQMRNVHINNFNVKLNCPPGSVSKLLIPRMRCSLKKKNRQHY